MFTELLHSDFIYSIRFYQFYEMFGPATIQVTIIIACFLYLYWKLKKHSENTEMIISHKKLLLMQYVSPHKLKLIFPVSHSIPVNPLSHAQVYPSSMAVHVPSFSHGLLSHSLMSTKRILFLLLILIML